MLADSRPNRPILGQPRTTSWEATALNHSEPQRGGARDVRSVR